MYSLPKIGGAIPKNASLLVSIVIASMIVITITSLPLRAAQTTFNLSIPDSVWAGDEATISVIPSGDESAEDKMAFTLSGEAVHGTFTTNEAPQIRWLAPKEPVRVNVYVEIMTEQHLVATVAIPIQVEPHPPVIHSVYFPNTPMFRNQETTFSITAVDLFDQQELQYTWFVNDEQISSSNSPQLQWTVPDAVGIFEITAQVADSCRATAAQSFTIEVENREPTLTIIEPTAKLEVSPGARVTIQTEALDPDGDGLHSEWNAPSGNLEITSDFSAVWTAPLGPGRYPVQIEVTDPYGDSSEKIVFIEVGDKLVVPKGTQVSLELLNTLRSSKVKVGDVFPLGVEAPLSINEFEVLGTGNFAVGKVTEVIHPGFRRNGFLGINLISIQFKDGSESGLILLEEPLYFSVNGGPLEGKDVIIAQGTEIQGKTAADVFVSVVKRPYVPIVLSYRCLGFSVRDLSSWEKYYFHDGVRVEVLFEDFKAEKNGLSPGDRIIGITTEGKYQEVLDVTGFEAIVKELEIGDKVTVYVDNVIGKKGVELEVVECFKVDR